MQGGGRPQQRDEGEELMVNFDSLLNATGTTWKCGHARRSPLAKLTWAKLMLAVQQGRLTKATAGREVGERNLLCLGCQYSRKQAKKRLAGHAALALIQIVVLWLWGMGAVR